MSKVNNKDTVTTPMTFISGVFIVVLKLDSHLFLVFLLLNLNKSVQVWHGSSGQNHAQQKKQ